MNSDREGLFGINTLLEALRSGSRDFEKVHIAKGLHGKGIDELIRLCKSQNIYIHFESRDVIERLSGTAKNQGVFGVVAAKGYSSVEDIIEVSQKRNEQPFILILDGVEDPRNLGAVIRTAEGAGVHGIIIPKHRSSGLTDVVARTSAGAIEYVHIAKVTNICQTIDWLKEQGVWVYGLDMKGEKAYNQLSYTAPLAIVIGGEGKGIRESVRKACDEIVRIPLFGKVSSLNVSVAAGVILFEIAAQRTEAKIPR
ncbi:MAG: 23S rRNA (guanosine(2251)-2'-O)-methyltransferase RlmB [Ignavibacteriae bacterium]|nr:23S rRNA (guanosine(2251)-2'-O)-methyltransferase RlmB [Ignavibacteriota bacterium]